MPPAAPARPSQNGKLWFALGALALLAAIYLGSGFLASPAPSSPSSSLRPNAPRRQYPAVAWAHPARVTWTAHSALIERVAADVAAHHARTGEWPFVMLTSDPALGAVGKSTLARAVAARLHLRPVCVSATDGAVSLAPLELRQRLLARVTLEADAAAPPPLGSDAQTLTDFDALFLSSLSPPAPARMDGAALILDDVTAHEQLLDLHRDQRAGGPVFATTRTRLPQAEVGALVYTVGALSADEAAAWLAAAVEQNFGGKVRVPPEELAQLVRGLNLRTASDADLVAKQLTTEEALAALKRHAQASPEALNSDAAVRAAHALLSADEQAVLARCAAFGVPFDADAFAAAFPESNPNCLEVLAARAFLIKRTGDAPHALFQLPTGVATLVATLDAAYGGAVGADRARVQYLERLAAWPASEAPASALWSLYDMRTPLHWVAQSANHSVLERLASALHGASWPAALRMADALARVRRTLEASGYDLGAHTVAVALPLLQARAESVAAVRLRERPELLDAVVRDMFPSTYGGLCGALGPTAKSARKAAQRGQRRFLRRFYTAHKTALRPADALNALAAWLEARCGGRYAAHELAHGAFWAAVEALGNDDAEVLALVQFEFELFGMERDDKYREYEPGALCAFATMLRSLWEARGVAAPLVAEYAPLSAPVARTLPNRKEEKETLCMHIIALTLHYFDMRSREAIYASMQCLTASLGEERVARAGAFEAEPEDE